MCYDVLACLLGFTGSPGFISFSPVTPFCCEDGPEFVAFLWAVFFSLFISLYLTRTLLGCMV
jgi:hypothetical protein